MELEQELVDGRKATPNRARVWTVEEISRLIKIWSKHEVLYNTRHPDYYKREKRSAAMVDLQDKLGGVTLVDIIRKMENLRSYFGREIKRLYESEMSAGGLKGQSRWAYFDSLLFLEEHMNQKRVMNTRSDDGTTRFESRVWENVDAPTEDETDDCYLLEQENDERQAKRQRLSDGSKQQAASIAKLPMPKVVPGSQVSFDNRNSSGLVAPVKATVRDACDSYPHPREQNRALPPMERMCSETHEDMVFAEHVGRTIMSITDELLKEDLKLQIQQCLCATKRKQIAYHQQHHALRSTSNSTSSESWHRNEKNDSQPPSFVSFVSIGSPGTSIHQGSANSQNDNEGQPKP